MSNPHPVHGSASTLRPFEYRGSEEYPNGIYNGHDLARANMPVVYSVGITPEEAIRALCAARLGEYGGTLTPQPERGDSRFTWGYRFTADGTGCKAAGVHVPGGVVLTWWK